MEEKHLQSDPTIGRRSTGIFQTWSLDARDLNSSILSLSLLPLELRQHRILIACFLCFFSSMLNKIPASISVKSPVDWTLRIDRGASRKYSIRSHGEIQFCPLDPRWRWWCTDACRCKPRRTVGHRRTISIWSRTEAICFSDRIEETYSLLCNRTR